MLVFQSRRHKRSVPPRKAPSLSLRAESVHDSYNSSTSRPLLLTNVLTNYHQLFCKVCLSSFLPIRDLYAGSYLQSPSCSEHSELLLLLQHHLFALLLKALSDRFAFPLASAAPELSSSCSCKSPTSYGGRSQPHMLIKQASSSLAVLMLVSLSRG